MTNHERTTRLQSYGLTENQAKAYLALLELGRATASALNKVSGVPRNKVYSVVEELNEKGLVDIVLEDPIVFEPRPLAHYLDLLINEMEARTSDLARRKQDLAEEFQIQRRLAEEDLQVGSFRLFRGRRAVMQQNLRMRREARNNVRALASPSTAARWAAAGLLDEYTTPDNGGNLEFQVYTPLTQDNQQAVEALHGRLGDRVRVVYDTPDNVVITIIDDRAAMFTHFVPDSDSTTSGDDIGVWTDNPVFLRLAMDRVRAAAVRSESYETAKQRLAGDRLGLPPQFEVIRDTDRAADMGYEYILKATHCDTIVPQDVLLSTLADWSDADRREAEARLERMRIITDAPPERLPPKAFIDGAEIRHLRPLPTRMTLVDDRLVRIYRINGRESDEHGDIAVSTNVESALEEARDYFDRLWESAEPIEPVGTPMVPSQVKSPEAEARRAMPRT